MKKLLSFLLSLSLFFSFFPTAGAKEPLPYEGCEDEQAVEWIGYKKADLAGRLIKALDGDGQERSFDNIRNVYERWKRVKEHAGKRAGIYFTTSTAFNPASDAMLDKLQAVGGNFLVFDISKSTLRELTPERLEEYRDFVKKLHERELVVVARLVVAVDNQEAAEHPEHAIKNTGGGVWKDVKGSAWLDLSQVGARDYLVGLMKKIVTMGVDEVQLDYIRFPTDGDVSTARYGFNSQKYPRWAVIRDTIRDIRIELAKSGTYLGADLLGIVGWNKGYDGYGTGQKIECLAPYLDAIYPMSYPSHFGPGFGGYKNPAGMPYFFVEQTIKYFQEYADGTLTDIRTWVQGFTYRVPSFDYRYVAEQIRAVATTKSDGYVIWNASNNYDPVWKGMK